MVSGVGSHTLVLSRGRFDHTDRADLDAIFKAAFAQQTKHIVIHFHGGLIDKVAGLAAAERLTPIYQGAGAYPIFFIWESGYREIIERNVPLISRESIFQRILLRVSQFSKAKLMKELDSDLARSDSLPVPPITGILAELNNPKKGEQPFADTIPDLPSETSLTSKEKNEFEQTLEDDEAFLADARQAADALSRRAAAAEIAPVEPERPRASTLMSDDVVAQGGALLHEMHEAPRGVVSTALITLRCAVVLARVISRFAGKRHHGFYLTIVQEILRGFYLGSVGKFFWDQMKRDIDAAFGFAQDCGGTAFVDALSPVWTGVAPPKVTFVGHSAGSIYACRLLKELQAVNLPPAAKVNLILIAAAIDLKSLAETLRAAGNRIAGFRGFGMGDELERNDALLGRVFPSSLLYFVSGVLEEEADMPLAGMQRFHSPAYEAPGFEYIAAVRQFELFARPHSFVWAPTDDGEGISCDMRSHGGWADAKDTVKSIQHIISSGFGGD